MDPVSVVSLPNIPIQVVFIKGLEYKEPNGGDLLVIKESIPVLISSGRIEGIGHLKAFRVFGNPKHVLKITPVVRRGEVSMFSVTNNSNTTHRTSYLRKFTSPGYFWVVVKNEISVINPKEEEFPEPGLL